VGYDLPRHLTGTCHAVASSRILDGLDIHLPASDENKTCQHARNSYTLGKCCGYNLGIIEEYAANGGYKPGINFDPPKNIQNALIGPHAAVQGTTTV
jgi:hypothetical protein